jgi:hypothetical protein
MTKRILIVEDNSDIRRLIKWALEPDNYEVHEASNGDQAMAQIKQLKPDLVLLDVMMPGQLDGFDVCQRIREDAELSEVHVIMLTARAQAKDRAEGEKSGADDYLVKPFKPMELVDAVKRALDRPSRNSSAGSSAALAEKGAPGIGTSAEPSAG